MRRIVFALSAVALLASGASADPIEDRQNFMKQNGRLLGAVFPVIKGEKPFDAAEVMAALQAFNDHTQTLDVATMFPPGSGEGDTRASPKIWDDMAGFQAEVDKFKAAAAASVSSPPQDIEALRAAFGAIGGSCDSCHEGYRLRRG